MQQIKFNGNIDWAGNATSKRTKNNFRFFTRNSKNILNVLINYLAFVSNQFKNDLI